MSFFHIYLKSKYAILLGNILLLDNHLRKDKQMKSFETKIHITWDTLEIRQRNYPLSVVVLGQLTDQHFIP